MKKFLATLYCLMFACTVWSQAPVEARDRASFLQWSQLPALPGTPGLAGAFAGVSNGALLVAGGANFPDGGAPWTGSQKQWQDAVYVLEQPGGQWKQVGKLPRPLAYGVSATWRNGVICAGGSDAGRHYREVYLLTYEEGAVHTTTLPGMPGPLANACGAVIGDVLYIAGGMASPGAKQAEKYFWSLDLAATGTARQWRELPAWPGPARMLAVAGVLDGAFYLMSGAELTQAAGDSIVTRHYLRDAYRYTPAKGWQPIAALPRPVLAAPSPAFATGQSHLLVVGGDDGRLANEAAVLRERHPGFSGTVLAYNHITNVWAAMDTVYTDRRADAAAQPGNSVWAPVTTPAVVWRGSLVIPSGEVRPAVRTPRVLMATPVQPAGAFHLLDWIVVGIYFLLVIGISVIVSRRMNNSTSDFFLGGGKIPWWAAGLSIFGSKLSALTFIAIPAKAYATDWVYLLNNIMIVAVAPLIVYFYLPYFRKMKLTSVYEYLRIRFNQRVKLLGSLTFVLFQVSRLGIVIYLPALVLSAVTGINIFVCIIGITVITTAYSVSGGIEAVVWTEVMQVVVLLGGALMALIFMAHSLPGGFGQLVSEATEHNKFRMAILQGTLTEPVLWVVLVGGFLTQLVTYSSDQVVVQRYLTTPTEKEARKSIYTNALLVIPASLIFFSVGTALWVFFRHNPGALNPNGRVDDVFPWYISHQLPSGLAGLVIAGLFAATMSTISSSMNSIATVVTTDFYQYLKPGSSDRQRFVFARRTTVVLGVLGFLIALYMVYLSNASIWDQYLKIIGLFGGCLAGMFVAGIFFPRINSTGIFIGFIVSAISLYFVQAANIVSFFLYPAVAVLVCVSVGYLGSLVWKEKR